MFSNQFQPQQYSQESIVQDMMEAAQSPVEFSSDPSVVFPEL